MPPYTAIARLYVHRLCFVYHFKAMSAPTRLTAELALHLSSEAAERLRNEPGLEQAVATWLGEARGAWPEIEISSADFLHYLSKRAATSEDPLAAIRAFNWPEVYLACACGRSDPKALQTFEQHYLAGVPLAIAHMRLSTADVDEVMQGIREKLMVPDAQGNTRIDEYAGGGSLHGLVKVMAVRAAISLTRKHGREHPDPDDQLLRLPAIDVDPELESVKQELRQHFKRAFEAAAEQLEPRERNLLRMHLLDGVTLGQLATTYSVHRATVTRWLAQARESLLKNTRKHLQDAAGDAEDLDGFVSLVQSRIDLSYRRLLKTHKD